MCYVTIVFYFGEENRDILLLINVITVPSNNMLNIQADTENHQTECFVLIAHCASSKAT